MSKFRDPPPFSSSSDPAAKRLKYMESDNVVRVNDLIMENEALLSRVRNALFDLKKERRNLKKKAVLSDHEAERLKFIEEEIADDEVTESTLVGEIAKHKVELNKLRSASISVPNLGNSCFTFSLPFEIRFM